VGRAATFAPRERLSAVVPPGKVGGAPFRSPAGGPEFWAVVAAESEAEEDRPGGGRRRPARVPARSVEDDALGLEPGVLEDQTEVRPPSQPLDVARIGGRPAADRPQPGHVTVATVRRFKGLEAALVIVVDVDFARAAEVDWRRRLYVACSRARHAVHIITTTPESALGDAVCALAGTTKARPTWRALARNLGVRLAGGNDDPFDEPKAG
jgi:hypothetical protein